MTRSALAAGLVAALASTPALAQNPPPKPAGADFAALGRAVAATGLKAETGQGIYKVALPGDDGWFVEVWPSKAAPLAILTFPCQTAPTGPVDPNVLLKLLAQNGVMGGAYFGYNDKTRAFYLETTVPTDGLTGEKLRGELDRLGRIALQKAELWDVTKWAGEKK